MTGILPLLSFLIGGTSVRFNFPELIQQTETIYNSLKKEHEVKIINFKRFIIPLICIYLLMKFGLQQIKS